VRNLLRIIEPRAPKTHGQDYGCCKDRPGETTPSGFIASSFQPALFKIWFEFAHRNKISVFRRKMDGLRC